MHPRPLDRVTVRDEQGAKDEASVGDLLAALRALGRHEQASQLEEWVWSRR